MHLKPLRGVLGVKEDEEGLEKDLDVQHYAEPLDVEEIQHQLIA